MFVCSDVFYCFFREFLKFFSEPEEKGRKRPGLFDGEAAFLRWRVGPTAACEG